MQLEQALCASRGHEVHLLETSSAHINGIWTKARTSLTSIYSSGSRRAVTKALSEIKPDVVHVHNFFPTLSPSVYFACTEAGIPVVQTLHNYRLLCPGATLFRKGQPCEECVGKAIAWRGIKEGCYRSSCIGSASVAIMASVHRGLRTYNRHVQTIIALTDFARAKYIEGGLPADRIVVKPNFIAPDPGIGGGHGEFVLFVGRLSEEKGLPTLLAAWRKMHVPLKIIGSGPLAGLVARVAQEVGNITYLGQRPPTDVYNALRDARALVLPSRWYEVMPLTIIESFASGIPVIASKLGAMESMIADGHTGLHFTPGDVDDLTAKVEWAWMHARQMRSMGLAARAEYEAKYTPERNYEILMEIYDASIQRRTSPHRFAEPPLPRPVPREEFAEVQNSCSRTSTQSV